MIEKNSVHHIGSPFDDDAAERLRRMGLLDQNSEPVSEAIAVLALVYSGLLYDDLCDFYQDFNDVLEVLQKLLTATEQADSRQQFLLICLQYDGIFRALPDPIWWMSGNAVICTCFTDHFLRHIRELADISKERMSLCEA